MKRASRRNWKASASPMSMTDHDPGPNRTFGHSVWFGGRNTASTESLRMAPAPRTTPERRLAVAMLDQCERDLIAEMPDAARWVLGKSAALPFELACDLLGLEFTAVRERLSRRYRLYSLSQRVV